MQHDAMHSTLVDPACTLHHGICSVSHQAPPLCFCREVIEQWLEKNVTSPLTGLQLRHGTLLENTAVKNAIAAMKA